MQINGSHRRGFTLIELIVVIFILMILTLVAVGGYSVMQQRRSLRAAAEGLNSAFVTARSYAISRNTWYRVLIQLKDPTTGAENFRYWIDEITMNSNQNPAPIIPQQAVNSMVTTPQRFPEGVRVIDANIRGTTFSTSTSFHYVVRFQPNGSSDAALIRLQQDTSATNKPAPIKSVRVHPATAKSKILTDATP